MLNDLKNKIDFFIRNKTKFSRKNFIETNKSNLELNKLENLYTFDILSKTIQKNTKKEAHILDIGCKNWFYAKGEYDFFSSFCENIFLDGIEIDPYRLYSNFYSRYEVAKYHTKNLKNTKYIPGNLLNINFKYDYIIWFLPFVTINPHKYWGLPENLFMPEKLLKHAYSLLKPEGKMLIVNQGLKEAQIQKELFEKLNITYESKGLIESKFLKYENDRFAYLCLSSALSFSG